MTQPAINIVNVEPAGDLRLRLTFDDGVVQTIDFRPFLSRSRHPSVRAYLEPQRFATYRLEFGDLVWGDFELCFPIIDLYRNALERNAPLDEAA